MMQFWRRDRKHRLPAPRQASRRSAPLCLEAFEDRVLLDAGPGTLGQETSLTELTASDNPAVVGQTITFMAFVAPEDGDGPMPTGFVAFREGDTDLGFAELTDGVAVFATASLARGTHFLAALYAGDDNYLSSESESLVQFVIQANTETRVASSGSPSVVGEAVTFTATVVAQAPGGGTPQGTVSFLSSGEVLGEAELDENGQASLTTTFTAAANYAITADYAGNDDHAGSTSAVLTQSVTRASTATALEADLEAAVFGQPVLLTARVTVVEPGSGTLTGSVTFRAGGVTLGTAAVDEEGVAEFRATQIPVGTIDLTAVYGGADDFLGSTSSAVSIQISRAGTDLDLTANPNPADIGEAITFTLTVTAQDPSEETPTGTVVLLNGNVVLATGQLQDGVAVFRISTLAVGRYTLTARYDGSAGFDSVTSFELEVFVGTLNQRWVAQVYRDLLQRQVDAGGLAAFARMLDQGDDYDVVAQRIMSGCGGTPLRCEFWELTVRNLYLSILRRAADPGGLAANVEFLRTGGTIAQVKASMFGSAEYFNNAQFGGGGNNSGFLTALFRDVLGRALTQQERTFWLQVLSQGATRESVALSLLRDSESLERVVTQYFERLLYRTPDQDELDDLVSQFSSGTREEAVIALIVAKFEYLLLV